MDVSFDSGTLVLNMALEAISGILGELVSMFQVALIHMQLVLLLLVF